jgi:hypothetical protein
MRVWASILVIFLTVVLILSSQSVEAPEKEDVTWTMFRGGPQRSGFSPYDTTQNEGGVNWTYKHGKYTRSGSGSLAISNEGTIFFGTSEPGGVIAINEDGTEKWIFHIDVEYRISSPSIGNENTIYIGAEHNLFAINPDGTEKWTFSTDDDIKTSPAIGPDGTIYFGSYDNNLYAVYPNGTLKWNFSTMGSYDVESSPALAPDGSIVFSCYLEEGSLVALYPNGTIKWILESDEFVNGVTPAIDENGTMYINGAFNNLYSIDTNGTINWMYPITHWNNDAGIFGTTTHYPAIGPDGTVYSGSREGLYAINPDGSLKWRSESRTPTRSPSVSGDGTIFVGMNGIIAFNPDGSERWIYDDNRGTNSELIIGKDGTILYFDGDRLVALNGKPLPNEKVSIPISYILIILMLLLLVIVGYFIVKPNNDK